jgi:hypothetical protein
MPQMHVCKNDRLWLRLLRRADNRPYMSAKCEPQFGQRGLGDGAAIGQIRGRSDCGEKRLILSRAQNTGNNKGKQGKTSQLRDRSGRYEPRLDVDPQRFDAPAHNRPTQQILQLYQYLIKVSKALLRIARRFPTTVRIDRTGRLNHFPAQRSPISADRSGTSVSIKLLDKEARSARSYE